MENGPKGDIGFPQGGDINPTNGDLELGQIFLQRATAVGVLCIFLTLFAASVILYIAIPNDCSEVIAALLRRETGQDALVPAVALGDRTLKATTIFDEENLSWREPIAPL